MCDYIPSMQTVAYNAFNVNNKFLKYVANRHATMANELMGKEESITIRTRSEIKGVLQKLADEGYRTLSQQCEMILIQWLRENDYLRDKQK